MISDVLLANKDKIVIATKYYEVEDIKKFVGLGFRNFGASRVSELKQKVNACCCIKWHYLGGLQTNKVKEIINSIDCLHSLDSLKLAVAINKYRDTPLDCFMQINITKEESKRGFREEEILDVFHEIKGLPNIRVIGLMTIAKQDDYKENIKNTFLRLVSCQKMLYNIDKEVTSLSMGMSDDYSIALEAQATHLRLGRIMKEVLDDV